MKRPETEKERKTEGRCEGRREEGEREREGGEIAEMLCVSRYFGWSSFANKQRRQRIKDHFASQRRSSLPSSLSPSIHCSVNSSSLSFDLQYPLIILIPSPSSYPSRPRHRPNIAIFKYCLDTGRAVEHGERRRHPCQPPSARRTKSQRTPLSNSFAHPITFRCYVQKFAVHPRKTGQARKRGR